MLLYVVYGDVLISAFKIMENFSKGARHALFYFQNITAYEYYGLKRLFNGSKRPGKIMGCFFVFYCCCILLIKGD
jgi:hypothetical protein